MNDRDEIKRKLTLSLRARLHRENKGAVIIKNIFPDLVGCTSDKFLNHLENQWDAWMSFANYGLDWELHHLSPLYIFDLTKLDEIRAAFGYLNTFPIAIELHRHLPKYCANFVKHKFSEYPLFESL